MNSWSERIGRIQVRRLRRALAAAVFSIGCFPVVSGHVAEAKVLYADDHGVRVVYDVVDTGQYTFCEGPPEDDLNYTDKKIRIWKVTLQITNGSGRKITPQSALIAHINVDPDQGSSLGYCSYRTVGTLRKLDGQPEQRKSPFGIASGVYFIGPGKTFSNSTYLYLYEDQKPLLTKWVFGGYTFSQDDGKANQTQSNPSPQPATPATPAKKPVMPNVKQTLSPSRGPAGSLILLIDVSGSMQGTKLRAAKQAAMETIRKAVKNHTRSRRHPAGHRPGRHQPVYEPAQIPGQQDPDDLTVGRWGR